MSASDRTPTLDGGVRTRDAAADAFFARTYTPDDIARMQYTPHELLEQWRRDGARHRAAHAAHMASARAAERAAARELQRQAAAQRKRVAAEREARKEARRVYARGWYARNRDQYLEYQREYRAAARAADPEGYRETMRLRAKKWYDAHRDQQNAKLRDKYHDNPIEKTAIARRYYAAHADEIKAQRRARRAANRESELAKQQRSRNREKLRRDAGLPVTALHRVSTRVRDANVTEADAFFALPMKPERRQRLKRERPTDGELLKAWARQMGRHRSEEIVDGRLPQIIHQRDVSEARRVAAMVRAHDRQVAAAAKEAAAKAEEAIEDARLDEIGRAVNARLRPTPPARARHHNDPAAPHTVPGSPTGSRGLSR